jgi:hypothetical protein
MRAQGVDEFRALADHLLARTKHDRLGLLLLGFRLDKAHCRPLCRLRDRLRIGRIILSSAA